MPRMVLLIHVPDDVLGCHPVTAYVHMPKICNAVEQICICILYITDRLRLYHAGDQIHKFMMSFTDGRDAGMLLVSHFSLLTGMAVPIWLSPVTTSAASARRDIPSRSELQHLTQNSIGRVGGASNPLPLTAFAGIMVLGIADSAASAVGRRYGRHRICIGTNKTVEGTLGAALLTLLGWALLAIAFQSHLSHSASASWDGLAGAKLLISTLLSCLLEASTTQLDNIFMSLHYLAMLSL